MGAEPPDAWCPSTLAATAHGEQREAEDDGQRHEVVGRHEGRPQVQERPVVGRRLGLGLARHRDRIDRVAWRRRRRPGATSGPAARAAVHAAVGSTQRLRRRRRPRACRRACRPATARGSSCRARRCRRRLRWSRTLAKASSVNRNDSSRTLAAVLTRVSESGRAKMTRSYCLSVLRRKARPSLTMRVTRGSSYGWFGMVARCRSAGCCGSISTASTCLAPRSRATRHVRAAAGADDEHVVVGPTREPA